MAASKNAVPAAVSIATENAALQQALSTLFSDLRQIDDIQQAARAVARLLGNDAAALAETRAEVERLGPALAQPFGALGANTRLDDFTSKPLRQALKERYQQLNRLVLALRLLGGQDDWLLALADAVGDNTIRWVVVEALSGGQYGLAPIAPTMLRRWIDARNNNTRHAAQHAQYAADPEGAHARWWEVLTKRDDAESICDVLDLLEANEKDYMRWASAIFPHLQTQDASLLFALKRFITLQPAVYSAYVTDALSASTADLPRMLEVIADRLYWASLSSGSLLGKMKAPLLQLRQRAAEHALTSQVRQLDLALKKLGVEVEATTAKHTGITLGKKLAQVGTEGGPPLAVPAAFLAAWQGVDGPEPFDSGHSDFERACAASPPALITIGAGKGIVLDEQSVTVHQDADGLLLHTSGDPAEADAERWERLGDLEVGPGGLVVLDATLSAKRKSADRAAVPLAAGVYAVSTHRSGGFGNDFSAVRLQRVGVAKKEKSAGKAKTMAKTKTTTKAKKTVNTKSVAKAKATVKPKAKRSGGR